MRLTLHRAYKAEGYTIGRLYVDRVYFCDTLEDRDRGLKKKWPLSRIRAAKVPGETAIPVGEYGVTLKVVSPRFRDRAQYAFCQGRLPRLVGVPGFEGVLIHIGNTARDSEGCILVGRNTARGKVLKSAETFRKLYALLERADAEGQDIWIDVQ